MTVRTNAADSDVDFIVDFAPHATVFDYVDIQESLSGILERKVDVVDSFVLGRDSRFTRQNCTAFAAPLRL